MHDIFIYLIGKNIRVRERPYIKLWKKLTIYYLMKEPENPQKQYKNAWLAKKNGISFKWEEQKEEI